MYAVSETFVEVRYYETDKMGIVHHSNYIRYFEYGRHKCLEDIGLPIEKIEELGVEMPVVSVECKYHKPAVMGDVLKIISAIEKEPMAKVEVVTEIFNSGGDLICSGKVVLGFLNKLTHRPTRAPKYFLDAFERNKINY